MKDSELRNKLCSVYCSHYKPSKESEPPCLGYSIIEKLLGSDKDISFNLPEKELDVSAEMLLRKNMCPSCPFHEEDCDFILQEGTCQPCGGFILIGDLLQRNVLTVQEIKDIASSLQANTK